MYAPAGRASDVVSADSDAEAVALLENGSGSTWCHEAGDATAFIADEGKLGHVEPSFPAPTGYSAPAVDAVSDECRPGGGELKEVPFGAIGGLGLREG